MIPIVFSADHNFIMPAGVTICSLLLSRGSETYDIYLLVSSDVTSQDKDLIQRQVAALSSDSRLTFIDMGKSFDGGYEIRGISKACYYRLMIPWLIPDIDKIIYCDVDLIVNTPLSELFNVDLTDKYVAGSLPTTEDGWVRMKKYFDGLGLDYKEYINSGVLVINSALQREHGLDEAYRRLSQKKFHYQDQDIINIVCKGHIAHFDCRFNFKPSEIGVKKNVGSQIIIHYAGDKPWKGFCFAWDEWWAVYKKSVFWDAGFYHNVSADILNPIVQLNTLGRKSLQKIKQSFAKVKTTFNKSKC